MDSPASIPKNLWGWGSKYPGWHWTLLALLSLLVMVFLLLGKNVSMVQIPKAQRFFGGRAWVPWDPPKRG